MTLFPDIAVPFENPVLIFATVMAIILVAPQVMNRFRIPGIVGLILAGAAVGPSAANLLVRDATIELLGTIGLLYLMFMAGISLDLHRFNKLRQQSLLFGLISFFLPQLVTLGVALFLLGFNLPAALLLGSIVGSHTLVAYPIAARLGLTKNTAVTMTLGGTLVTDTLSLAILAIVVAANGENTTPAYWISFATMVGLYVLGVLVVLPRLGHWFFRTVRNRPEVEFAFLLTVLFVTAFLAEFVGLAPIIGAFLAGLAMNRLIPDQSTLVARLRFNGDALFIPFFLISVGLLIDFGVLFQSPRIWLLAAVLIALVTIGKLVAAKLIQRVYNYSSDEGWTIYGLSVPQAAATLAVTLLGYEVGLFDSALVNAVVVMILFTCVLGPWLVERYGLRIAHQDEPGPAEPLAAPERILIPLANPKTSGYLLDLALLMRDPGSGEPIFPMMVVSDDAHLDERLALKQEKLKFAVERGAEAGVPVTPLTRIDVNTAHGIARAAREERISMILIGWNGEPSTRERIFGTVVDQLLDETKQMVLVNRIDHPLNTTRKVILAIPPFAERGPGFYEALHAAKLLAARVDARLEVICECQHHDFDRQVLGNMEPHIPIDFDPIDDWSQILETFDAHVAEETHVVVLSARRGTPPWFAELDDIPRLLADNFPQVTFSIVYLAQD